MAFYCIDLGYRRIASRGRGRIDQGCESVHTLATDMLNSLSEKLIRSEDFGNLDQLIRVVMSVEESGISLCVRAHRHG
jgi:hypothetical protein